MTSADYVAIAISPVLIMALVGSLVFFLVEVLYVGQYSARLDYAFALFVMATVLIARISIEMGSERAALFALPLAIAMFLFLLRFVEHPSPYSHLINLLLMGVVWWCADRLTWDSTVIEDDEDASGEGLMQRIGVDGPGTAPNQEGDKFSASTGPNANELFEDASAPRTMTKKWWQRITLTRRGPHSPGTWVLYFSLAALPLFGVGQHWIPIADVGRRRYVFGLLLVYVAAALALLVTTSFLNLRRYLRQRRVEMPLPIAGTWVGVGASLIVIVMLLAALVPRPSAEIALSRVPWQTGSPGDLAASRTSIHRDGGAQQGDDSATSGEATNQKAPPGDQYATNDHQSPPGQNPPTNSQSEATSGKSANQDDRATESSQAPKKSGNKKQSVKTDENNAAKPSNAQARSASQNEPERHTPQNGDGSRTRYVPPAVSHVQSLLSQWGGLAAALKILFYAAAALIAAYCIWRYRHEIIKALADILRQLRDLFGGFSKTRTAAEEEAAIGAASRPSFHDFHDPFVTGQHSRLSPEELVRYTFAAFEAWANDRGSPRSPDCTPQELVALVVEPKTRMHSESRRLIRLYSHVAYASKRIPRGAAYELNELWQLMRTS